jgi:hypothetical protein
MKKLVLATVIASGLWAGALTLAAASIAAPSGASSVEQATDRLEADGYTVIVNRVGAGPIDKCTLATVRPGQTYSRTDSGTPGAQDDVHTTVTGRTVFVDLAC